MNKILLFGHNDLVSKQERRERERQELRQQILSAARHIAVKDGFEALSMRRIADAVEHSPGTLYLYFKDRDEIAAHVCAAGLERIYAYLFAHSHATNPVTRLKDLALAYVQFSEQEPEIYQISLMTEHKYSEAVARTQSEEISRGIDAGNQAIALLQKTFFELQQEGRLREGTDVAMTTHTLWAGLHGICSLSLTFPHLPLPDRQKATDVLVNNTLNGILNHPARQPGSIL